MNLSTKGSPKLFISDVHFGGFSNRENNRIEAELIQLINFCQRNKISLVLLGDLFDYWMEYPNHVPKLGKRLLDRFESYNKDMGPTLYITGNHDNWTRNHLRNRGFDIESEYRITELGENKIMLMHGDGLAEETMNLPRPLMHRILRDETFISIFQKVFPPAAGIQIMKYFSRISRFLSSEANDGRIEKLNNWAKRTLNKNNLDYLICGHDHLPRQLDFNFGTYINLGTFYRHRTMAYYNNDNFSLVYWHPQLQSLKPFNNIDE